MLAARCAWRWLLKSRFVPRNRALDRKCHDFEVGRAALGLCGDTHASEMIFLPGAHPS